MQPFVLLLFSLAFYGCSSSTPDPVVISTVPPVAADVEPALEAQQPATSDEAVPPTPTLNPQVVAQLDQQGDQGILLPTATPSPEFSPTPLPTPTPTRVLPPSELLSAGLRELE
ncbi:MAG: hypothetical protein AAGD96_31155, partial [Chloroflexota bacterium]